MRFVLFLLFATRAQASSANFEKLVDAAMDILADANLGTTIRQCSCDEDEQCVKLMQVQVMQCANNCWRAFSEITKNPESLYKCITEKVPVISVLIRCISENIKSCVNTNNGPQIPQVDLKKMFNTGEQRLLAAHAEVFSNSALMGLRPIGEAAIKFGSCVKRCFVDDQNHDGFCYDGKSCQPLITQHNLRRALRVCLPAASWKNHVADLCKCALNAGVGGLNDVCSLLQAARSG